jgi:polysaccharide pyruvyl transferase WcaK-like protein
MGVEDPTESRFGSLTDRDELRAWAKVIPEFDRFSVRGPRSAELLAEFGVTAEAIGDPAFLLEPEGGITPGDARDETVVVNVGVHETTWADDPRSHLRALIPPLRRAATQGLRTTVLIFRNTDREISNEIASQVDGAIVLDVSTDLGNALATIGRSRFAIMQRLHGAILASIAGTPTLMIEYRPKARDISMVLGSAMATVRIDSIQEDHVEALLSSTERSWQDTHSSLAEATQRIRSTLDLHVTAIRSQLLEEL